MRTVRQLGVIAVLTLGSAVAIHLWHPNSPPLYLVSGQLRNDEIRLDTALEWRNGKGIVWIDSRTSKDYYQGHVDGAFLLNKQEDFYALLEPIWAQIQNQSDLPFVVYCGSDACAASRQVAKQLRDSVGIAEVYILKGGDSSLREAGLLK